jgi:predicted ATPase with chaperone activity
MNSTDDVDLLAPPVPETIEDTGLPASLVEQLLLKIMYFRGDMYGHELATAVGLPFSVISAIMDALKLQHMAEVKRSLGFGNVSALFSLTVAGRERAKDTLELNQYAERAPVPITQYAEMVRKQRPKDGWLTPECLATAYRHMVVTPRILGQIGPAVSAGKSFLIYGKPGDGKTYLAESLNKLDTAPIYLPYAIECQGNIVQLYDPIYHERVEEGGSESALTLEPTYDMRWIKCRRPFIMTGGELSLDMLDLSYNSTSKVYDAPFQLKANNGIYLIDDFGRQRASPAEVLNRWIVPMERKMDYLSFRTGGKMEAPFEAFLIFSTNLRPSSLGDEAFLRRIQYKMLLRGPGEKEFTEIFERFCAQNKLNYRPGLVTHLLDTYYRPTGRAMRRCHPRDILTHAMHLIHFEKLPYVLTDEVLDRAVDSCFVSEEEDEGATIMERPRVMPITA